MNNHFLHNASLFLFGFLSGNVRLIFYCGQEDVLGPGYSKVWMGQCPKSITARSGYIFFWTKHVYGFFFQKTPCPPFKNQMVTPSCYLFNIISKYRSRNKVLNKIWFKLHNIVLYHFNCYFHMSFLYNHVCIFCHD